MQLSRITSISTTLSSNFLKYYPARVQFCSPAGGIIASSSYRRATATAGAASRHLRKYNQIATLSTTPQERTMSSYPTFPLSHGGPIPIVGYGLGTAIKHLIRANVANSDYKSSGDSSLDQQIVSYVETSIKTGFYHQDGAEGYGNEAELGTAIKNSGIDRSKIFLTTKIYKSISSPKKALATSLEKLQTDYVDLYLIHAPFWNEREKGITIEQAWAELEELHKEGKAKAIGVSNFRVQDLERIAKVAKVQPAVNQIEYHPYLQSPELLKYHKEHGIITEAYGPLTPLTKAAGGPLDQVIEKLAKKYGKSPTQIILRWTVDTGVVAVTTSFKDWRMKEALAISEFKLDPEDVEEISKVGAQKHVRIFWTKEFKD